MVSSSNSATVASPLQWVFVDTQALIVNTINEISNLPKDPPSLYVDLEGINLSRYGTVSLLNVFVLPRKQTYLIDTHILGQAAFDTPSTNGLTLKIILESPLIPKVLFDLRNDADALYNHYGVLLANVHDVQLLELAAHKSTRRTVSGLAMCIVRDLKLTDAESSLISQLKVRGKKLFAPECGGSYEVFNTRPLDPDLIEYCINDVALLPRLWYTYNVAISPKWSPKLAEETAKRMMCPLIKDYEPGGGDKALNPWRIQSNTRSYKEFTPAHRTFLKSNNTRKREPEASDLISGTSRTAHTLLPVSNKSLDSRDLVNEMSTLHISSANEKRPATSRVSCLSCIKAFKTEESLAQHTIASHGGENGTPKLVDIQQVPGKIDNVTKQPSSGPHGIKMRYSAELNKHQDTALASGSTSVPLGFTQTPFIATATSNAKQPKPVQRITNSRRLPCISCPRFFATVPALHQHRQASHPLQDPTRHSIPAQPTFSVPLPLRPVNPTSNISTPSTSIMKNKVPAPKTNHTCVICTKEFKSGNALMQHTRDSHTKESTKPRPSTRGSENYSPAGYYGSSGYQGSGYSSPKNYGLCDKDCAWCGHCADGI